MKPPVICIVGRSKNMKLMIMQELISELKAGGLRVGALKYHKHGDFDIDIEGKDTWKYAKAGADIVAISSSIKFALIKKESGEPDIDDIIEKYFADCNIVLADGFTLSYKPRIIVTESEEDIELFKRGCEVVAVIDKNVGREAFKNFNPKVFSIIIIGPIIFMLLFMLFSLPKFDFAVYEKANDINLSIIVG